MASQQSSDLDKELQRLQDYAGSFFRNYDQDVSKKLFVAVMDLYGKNVDPAWQTQAYRELYASCKGDFGAVVDKLFAKSLFTDEARVNALLTRFDAKKVEKDPFYILAISACELIETKVRPELVSLMPG